MGSSRRWWLNHETHSSVASSTASRVFQGPRRWMSVTVQPDDVKPKDGTPRFDAGTVVLCLANVGVALDPGLTEGIPIGAGHLPKMPWQ